MSREQLENVAQEHQVKNARKMTDENLAFAILDAQATAASLQPIERPKAKRGRPKKSESQQKKEAAPVQTPEEEKPLAADIKQEDAAQPKAKRGRKPKNSHQPAQPSGESKTEVKVEPKPADEPAKEQPKAPAAASAPSANRGR